MAISQAKAEKTWAVLPLAPQAVSQVLAESVWLRWHVPGVPLSLLLEPPASAGWREKGTEGVVPNS